jgi:hypothetical protein
MLFSGTFWLLIGIRVGERGDCLSVQHTNSQATFIKTVFEVAAAMHNFEAHAGSVLPI